MTNELPVDHPDGPRLDRVPRRTRVFVLDDHEVVRRGVAHLIESEPDLHLIGEASSVREARARIPATTPDVALLDVRLPDGNGIDLCRELNAQALPTGFLIFTAHDDEQARHAALIAGAAGYLVKDIRGNQLVAAIRAVAAGKSIPDRIPHERTGDALALGERSDPRLDSLSMRERQVLALISSGLTNRQIGERLTIAEKTVKNYVSGLLAKLGFEHRTQAAIFAVRGTRSDD
ncbi:response regulator transcription factor [Salinibacterium sp. ZJ450]|uniref:response regulator n=1 Tax=Salinibacterium sp. ZJ450 TaxID=2708338 RepID=UPI00141F4609|nr:response regulator transcription factor [Salinibacterium sp. ZJ450]